MPTEALENLMLDALEAELVKIGTPPTSNWLTTTPPVLKMGVPGDKPAGPNKTSLYVQHVQTIPGSDSVGVTEHRIDATFHIWCVCHDPGDGLRRMLSLKQDVLNVLLAAEPTFYAMFQYGLELGPFSFNADEAYIRAGMAIGVQEVRVHAHLPHDGVVRFGAQALSIDLEKTLLRVYPFSSLPPVERASAGIAARLEPPALVLESTANGPDKLLEMRVEGSPTDQWFEGLNSEDWYGYEAEIACQLGPYFHANPTPTMFMGIEMGTYDQLPPFPASATNPVAQLRWNYGLARFELVSGVGDGVTPDTIVPLDGISMVPGGGARARLIFDPFSKKLTAMINGVVGAEISDPAKLPNFGNNNSNLLKGVFVTSGTHAQGYVQGVFAACHCKLYNTQLPAAP